MLMMVVAIWWWWLCILEDRPWRMGCTTAMYFAKQKQRWQWQWWTRGFLKIYEQSKYVCSSKFQDFQDLKTLESASSCRDWRGLTQSGHQRFKDKARQSSCEGWDHQVICFEPDILAILLIQAWDWGWKKIKTLPVARKGFVEKKERRQEERTAKGKMGIWHICRSAEEK